MGLIDRRFITGFEFSDAINVKVIVVRINNQDELLKSKNLISRTLMNTNRLESLVINPESEFSES